MGARETSPSATSTPSAPTPTTPMSTTARRNISAISRSARLKRGSIRRRFCGSTAAISSRSIASRGSGGRAKPASPNSGCPCAAASRSRAPITVRSSSGSARSLAEPGHNALKCVIGADAFRAREPSAGAFSGPSVHPPLIVRPTRPILFCPTRANRAEREPEARFAPLALGGCLDPRILRVSSAGQSLGSDRAPRPVRFRRAPHRRRPQPDPDDETAPRRRRAISSTSRASRN